MALTPHTRFNHYEVLASLGAGGMSEREMEVFCRVLPSGLLRIITVYQLEV